MLPRLLLIMVVAMTPAKVVAQDVNRYFAVVLGSVHFGVDLNDFNPGLLVGQRWASRTPGLQYHVEGGIFYNSYEEVSPIVMGGFSHRLFDIGSVEVRGGLSVGTAYYGEVAPRLKRDYGIPNVGGFIPLAVASVSLRTQSLEYRFTVLPGEDLFGAINLSVAMQF